VNWFDVVLGLLFAVGLVGGYFQGLIRQALSLGAVACGIILATYLHLPLAAWFAFMFPDTAVTITDTGGFLLALLLLVSVWCRTGHSPGCGWNVTSIGTAATWCQSSSFSFRKSTRKT